MKAIEFLIKNQSDTAGKWREEAEYRRRNARKRRKLPFNRAKFNK